MPLWEILTPIKKYKEHLKRKCFTDLGNVFTYKLDVLSLYSSLLKFHLLSWLARWGPNYASHPRQVQCHISTCQLGTLTNTPPSPQRQCVWNTLIFYFISNLLLFYSSYHSFFAFINPVLCFERKVFYIYTLFLFSSSNPSSNQTGFLALLNKPWPFEKALAFAFFLTTSPYRNTWPLPPQSKFYPFFKIIKVIPPSSTSLY